MQSEDKKKLIRYQEKQDKIVIFNELITVMKSILLVF